jgi:hypothetical protein
MLGVGTGPPWSAAWNAAVLNAKVATSRKQKAEKEDACLP